MTSTFDFMLKIKIHLNENVLFFSLKLFEQRALASALMALILNEKSLLPNNSSRVELEQSSVRILGMEFAG